MEKFGTDEAQILAEALRKLDRLSDFTITETNEIKDAVNDVIVYTKRMAEITMKLVETNSELSGRYKELSEQNDKLHNNLRKSKASTNRLNFKLKRKHII